MKNRLYLVGLGNIALISALELLPSQIPISPLSAVVIALLINFPLLAHRA